MKRHWIVKAAMCAACFFAGGAQAQQSDYGLDTWVQDIKDTRWYTGGAVAGVTALGMYSWGWGSSKTFRWNPEGWFGERPGSGGADKLGHAFTSYALTNVLADQLVRQGKPAERAALSAALTTQAIMLYVEVFDGYSNDHGFAREDVVMNMLGTGFAYARTVHPQLRDLLDYRMEYQPSGYKGFRPFSDYEGQKYLLALKLGGFDALRKTPLRYFELQLGYDTRGFAKEAAAAGFERRRESFVGVGINLNSLLFGERGQSESELKNAGRLFFEHINVPHTAARSAHQF